MKLGKRLMSLALALVMVLSLTVGASAATTQNIKVQLSPNITVKYNGEAQNMTDVNGNPVYPVLNGGTTYLPVRAVSGMLGIGVDWDGPTRTVLLNTSKKTTPTKTDGKAPANTKPSEITVQLSPNITVKLDGKAQSMTDVNGNPVYPLLYNGTTYLPIRAVSNMLGLNVAWDGGTQTVYLAEPRSSGMSTDSSMETNNNKATVTIERPTVEEIRETMEMFGYPDDITEAAIAEFVATGPNGKNGEFIYAFELSKAYTFKTSENAKILDDKHLACDYAEVDYSMADEGYVQVKLTKQITKTVYGFTTFANDQAEARTGFPLKLDQWVKIPLTGGNDKYKISIKPQGIIYEVFNVAFDAEPKDPDAWMLMSTALIDFENAPKTVAKAEELTKNCKTDAEKITAIFEFVAKTIKYDNKLIEAEKNQLVANGFIDQRNYNLDDILDSKTGVCEHYAILMAGMLRSQGIPCKLIGGLAYNGKDWVKHAWVAISPDTKGLNMSRLGAGHEPDGWIRLDPTWGNTASGRAKAAIDKNHTSQEAY